MPTGFRCQHPQPDRVEAEGLCERKRCAEVRRVVQLALIESGTAAAADLPAIVSNAQSACLAGFSQKALDALKSMVRRIVHNAEALHHEATPTDFFKTTP